MKKSTLETALTSCKVSANNKKSSIRFVASEVSEILGFTTGVQVVSLVNFIRKNRELTTTRQDAGMVKFFKDSDLITVGVTARLCAEAYDLYSHKKSWADRKVA